MLHSGQVCSRGGGPNTKPHVCTQPDSCDMLPQSIRDNQYFDVCTFNRRVPIVCCPPGSGKTTLAKTRISHTAVESECAQPSGTSTDVGRVPHEKASSGGGGQSIFLFIVFMVRGSRVNVAASAQPIQRGVRLG